MTVRDVLQRAALFVAALTVACPAVLAQTPSSGPGGLPSFLPQDGSVRGRLVEQFGSGQTFVLPSQPGMQPFNVELPPALSEALLENGQGLPELDFKIAPPVDGTSATLVVEEAQLPSVRLFQTNRQALMAPQLQELRSSLSNLEMISRRALGFEKAATLADLEAAQLASLSQARESLMVFAASTADVPRPEAVEATMETFETLLSELEPVDRGGCANTTPSIKAIYCRDSKYTIDSYRKIAAISHGVVGIRIDPPDGNDPTCSGSLIGEKLVLTSAHCLLRDKKHHDEGFYPLGDVRVIFDHERSTLLPDMAREDVPVARMLHPDLAGRTSLPEHDFVLLEIARTPEPKGLMTKTHDRQARQVCLSTHDLAQNHDTYLLGHPDKEHRQIADFGRVLFPFRIRGESKLNVLRTTVLYGLKRELDAASEREARLASLDAVSSVVLKPTTARALELWQRWEQSYVNNGSVYEHFSRLWQGQATIGLEIDGYEGNSGGPVMDRATHRQIGVFREGQPDTDEVLVPSWQTHEAALPVEAVLTEMATSNHTDWMETYRVCAYGRDGAASLLWSEDTALQQYCQKICL